MIIVERTKVFVATVCPPQSYPTAAMLMLRAAVAFAFIYPATAAFFNPAGWIWFVPMFIDTIIPREIFLQLFGLVEIGIALGILFMRNPTYPTIAAIAILGTIVVMDLSVLDITFRDVSILLAAGALILLHRAKISSTVQET